MLTASDLIRLPYTPDLTQAGIDYARQSLPFTYDRMGGKPVDRLRHIVAGVAVELAFRRYLSSQEILYDNLGATPFTDPDRYDVSIGGRRCDLKSFQFFQKSIIRQIRRDPGILLQASALVPADQILSDHMKDNDLYIFAFLTGLITRQQTDLDQAQSAGQPVYWIHTLPIEWNRPPEWRSLGPLALKSESGPALTVELGGQSRQRTFLTEEVTLLPGKRARAKNEFFSLAYLRIMTEPGASAPQGRVGIHSPGLQQTYVIAPGDWGNIWIYGMDIFLTGYMTRGEFRRRGAHLPAGSRVMQYPRTRTKNQALLVRELHPLSKLWNAVR